MSFDNTKLGTVAEECRSTRRTPQGYTGDMPSWIVPVGLLEHFLVGIGLTAVLALLGTPPVAILVAVTSVGFAHELGDGDFRRDRNGPWNGIVDLVAFLPAPIAWLIYK